MKITRREFLRTTSAGTVLAASGLKASFAQAAKEQGKLSNPLVDVNIWLSRWPTRRLPLDNTERLAARLRSRGVTRAWAGSFDGLLHKDIGAVNTRLCFECRRHGQGILSPFGTINPKLPDWREELRRCQEEHRMRGIRLHPNYHGYKLDDPELYELLGMAATRGLIVQLVAGMEDERMQHALMRVPNVDLSPLPAMLALVPRIKLVLLNWPRAVKPELHAKLAKSNQVWFDVAMVEGVGGIERLLESVPEGRVLFGSHAPFYYFEAALLKLKESFLSGRQSRKIAGQNALEIMERGA
jgi:hypothetical protein